jgi:Asp-tRNA(Asn)/Glu-tRNA(Gln) amidotransferase A subunit family amidase
MANPPAVSFSIRSLRQALASGAVQPSALAAEAFARSNQNSGRNTYLWQDADFTHAEAAHAAAFPRQTGGPFGDGRAALWGLPVSVKDCFDLAGAPTTCGVRFYRDLNGIAARDSWLVAALRASGAVLTGKTHLHALAWGITGENPEFGDCLQPEAPSDWSSRGPRELCSRGGSLGWKPGNPGALTGGSSSGAVASVREGSAVAAIGTDTGGSVRVPAALCGLAGYRSSLGRGDWRGGAHLAESFDTLGWLFRDLEDAPYLAAPFAPEDPPPVRAFTRFAFVSDSFLEDCEPAILASFRGVVRDLQALGLEAHAIDPAWWRDSREIFAPIQAAEAAHLHAGHFEQFEPAIRDRLNWGASLRPDEVASLRKRHAAFRARMDELFAEEELILLPCAPVARLAAGADHTQTRPRLLRYTAPFSLAGVPCVAVPCAVGGVQLAAPLHADESLLALAALLGKFRRESQP